MIRYRKVRARKERRKTSKIEQGIVGLIICGILSLPFFFLRHHFSVRSRSHWSSTEVQVLGTRIVIAYATDAGEAHAATFYYRAEAEVRYVTDGKQIHVWLPASRTTRDRAELQMWLSDKKGKFATVLWNPAKPGDGKVKLTSDIGSHFADFD